MELLGARHSSSGSDAARWRSRSSWTSHSPWPMPWTPRTQGHRASRHQAGEHLPHARGPKILDFGLAKSASGPAAIGVSDEATRAAEALLTNPGNTLGTVSYMSPEQVRATPLDARTDLFSFGVVLYEMATGTRPFRGESTGTIFDAILNRAPVPPVRLNPDVPAEVERVIDKCLEKDRTLRYQHASDIRTDLQRLKAGDSARLIADATRKSRDAPKWPSAATVASGFGVPLSFTAPGSPTRTRLFSPIHKTGDRLRRHAAPGTVPGASAITVPQPDFRPQSAGARVDGTAQRRGVDRRRRPPSLRADGERGGSRGFDCQPRKRVPYSAYGQHCSTEHADPDIPILAQARAEYARAERS